MKTLAKALSYENRVRAFWAMAAACLMLLFVYIFSINATARNVAEKQQWGRQIAAINSELESLEFSYIELKNEITLELARTYGFREVARPLYVSRDVNSSLSLNSPER